jgi:hypothetical protein
MILACGVDQAPQALVAACCNAFGCITILLKNGDLMIVHAGRRAIHEQTHRMNADTSIKRL